jgi:uncharacterized repeat protein (TIGR03803 family)
MRKIIVGLFLFILFGLLPSNVYASSQILHSFTGSPSDGQTPDGSLIRQGQKLFGMTQNGGSNNNGTIFSLNLDGSGYQLLHNFSVANGTLPNGALTYKSGILYGMTYSGGDNDLGTIFSISENGTNFTILHHFEGGVGQGARPLGSLLLIGDTLYGMTSEGGADDVGVLFSINTDASGFAVLHEFSGDTNDGAGPRGTLIVRDNRFYGTTSAGGVSNLGTIFSVRTDGTDFNLLHSFSGDDGEFPEGDLVLDDRLYGLTPLGGDGDLGVIFSITTTGTDFRLLREFSGSTSDGGNPHGSLIKEGSTLFGLTNAGGIAGSGSLFSIGISGFDFSILSSFTGSNGENPTSSLIKQGSMLYGTTSGGGNSDNGVVFAFNTAGSSSEISSSSSSNSCSNLPSVGIPDLFQINTKQNTATLFFTPVSGSVSGYAISYGITPEANQYGTTISYGSSTGVISSTINALYPGTWYFKVVGINGCASGNWGNTMSANIGMQSVFYRVQ